MILKPSFGAKINPSHWQAQGLALHYPFLETSGLSTVNKTGLDSGTFVNTPVWSDGQFGKAVKFDASSSQQIDCGLTRLAGQTLTQLTLCGWMYKSTSSGSNASFGFSDTPNRECDMIWYLDSHLYTQCQNNNGTYEAYTSTTITDGWHHFAMVLDGSATPVLKLYYDGALQSMNPSGALSSSYVVYGNFRIGYEVFQGRYSTAMFDDIRFYTRALSGNELQQIIANPWDIFTHRRTYPTAAVASTRRDSFLLFNMS